MLSRRSERTSHYGSTKMTDEDDAALLKRYAVEKDERAFGEIFERYFSLVHRTAFAKTGDSELANDVASAVFALLAERAGSIGTRVVLVGWLFKTATFIASNAVRIEQRRKKHEARAAQMTEASHLDDFSSNIETLSLIDNALMNLGDKDRNAVLLRYALGCTVTETADVLKITEGAAQQRALRALERLRKYCAAHGGAFTIAALAALLAIEGGGADAAVVPQFSISNSRSQQIYQGAVKQMAITKLKIAAGILGAAAIIGISGFAVIKAQGKAPQAHPAVALPDPPVTASTLHIAIPRGSAHLTYSVEHKGDSSWKITEEYWTQNSVCMCFKDTAYYRFTNGLYWGLENDGNKVSGPSISLSPTDKNAKGYFYTRQMMEDTPFLGFWEPAKECEPSSPVIKKTANGWRMEGKAPNGMVMDSTTNKPFLMDVALTFDRLGRLTRFERRFAKEGAYDETYSYSDFAKINGVWLPKSISFRDSRLKYSDTYRVIKIDTSMIDDKYFSVDSWQRQAGITDYRKMLSDSQPFGFLFLVEGRKSIFQEEQEQLDMRAKFGQPLPLPQ
jgi:RNA polymerase sigma factor (sigma-70 family)